MQATGMELPNGEERVLIPDHEWCDLVPFQRKGRTDLLVRKGQSVSGASGYNDVMVLRQSVMALWPLVRREECDKLLPRHHVAGRTGLYAAVLRCPVDRDARGELHL